ncbi:zinc finger and BTB domain-containing protein 17-like isoform X32 [Diorhabda carinulata]|uniref:zinc finger and BTB domain-containing protein 17-like isoform X32 n=1 Tax=Diorhabda carinulata TaxID=1163345 RepID=UPI0025A0327D|nr:zinc finger and BTB domain-containing protein 17-like isoform X32 [Diorhabda carinulata]
MDNNNMLKLCRLCLVKDDVNIPIFEEQGDIRQIFLKISSCLPVKVSRDDQLPKKICDGCSYKLDMLYEFWNTSANAEKQLLTWLGEAGMSSQMADGTISAVAQQIKPADAFVKQETIDPPDIHMDDDDDDDEEDKDYMKQEDNSNNVEEPPPKRARRTAAVKAAIALDQNSDDDDDSGEPMTKVEDDSEDSDNEDHEPAFVDVPSTSADDQPGPSGVGKDGVEAPFISLPAVKKIPILVSKVGYGNKGVQAQMSPEEYNSCLVKPIQLEIPLICRICDTTCTNNIDYGFHSIKHNNLYVCHMCEGYSHENKSVFEKHVREHEGITKFKCPICEKPFQTLRVAFEHRFIHENKKPFVCDICNREFYASYSLKKHKKQDHHESPIYQKKDKLYCKLCNKHYRNSSGMSYHNFRKHKDLFCTNPVLCEICGLDFPNDSNLKRHMNKHTTNKLFSCEICSKSFTHSHTLNTHKLVQHTGAKRYRCEYCGKKFPFHTAYDYHLKLHTGEKPHGCLICEKKFISMGNLRLHMKHFHKCTT